MPLEESPDLHQNSGLKSDEVLPQKRGALIGRIEEIFWAASSKDEVRHNATVTCKFVSFYLRAQCPGETNVITVLMTPAAHFIVGDPMS